MSGKLHAEPGDKEQRTKGQNENAAKNRSQDKVQSISPIELPEALQRSDAGEAAPGTWIGPKLAGRWAVGKFVASTLNTLWLVHLSTDSILEISPRLPSFQTCQ